MILSADQRKRFRTIGHQLKPIITVAERGISENITQEVNRALEDHELVKIKCEIPDRKARAAIIQDILKLGQAELVQSIGKIILIYRPAKKPNPKLSNLLRQQN